MRLLSQTTYPKCAKEFLFDEERKGRAHLNCVKKTNTKIKDAIEIRRKLKRKGHGELK